MYNQQTTVSGPVPSSNVSNLQPSRNAQGSTVSDSLRVPVGHVDFNLN